MYSENQKRKDNIYSTTCFSIFPFSSCKRKNENIYNGSYFYFSFFVCGLRKKKRILMYPFPIFYHEIEKRKTKGRYIHGPTYPTNVEKLYLIKKKLIGIITCAPYRAHTEPLCIAVIIHVMDVTDINAYIIAIFMYYCLNDNVKFTPTLF